MYKIPSSKFWKLKMDKYAQDVHAFGYFDLGFVWNSVFIDLKFLIKKGGL
jgi:hypothetical protein